MVDIMDTLGHGRFRLAGHDRGGRVAYRLALDHPERVERMATLDIVPTYDMWQAMDRNMAMKVWHWPFLAQPAPLPEMLIGKAPVEYLEWKMASWTKAKNLSAFDPRALDHYRAAFSEPARIHAHCEDYRAGAAADFTNDETDRKAGKTIACPLLALWGARRHSQRDRRTARHLAAMGAAGAGRPHRFRSFPHRGKSGRHGGGLARLFHWRLIDRQVTPMHPVLRFYEDVLSSAENVEFRLPPLARFIFVVHGDAIVKGKALQPGEGWQGEDTVTVKPGPQGVTVWRWELTRGDQPATTANAPGMITHEKLTAFLETLPKGELLMRADSVAFPPGGCAYTHVHQGPGIRCLIEGGIRVDTHHRSTSYGPGGAWYEAGPDPVFAQAAEDKAEPFHPCVDPAAGAAGKKLSPIRQRRRQGEAEVAAVQDLRRRADRVRGEEVTRRPRRLLASPRARGEVKRSK